jgi:hypothetical protein
MTIQTVLATSSDERRAGATEARLKAESMHRRTIFATPRSAGTHRASIRSIGATLACLLLVGPAHAETPPRFELEVLDVIHSKLTAENYARIEALFSRVYPDLDMRKLKPTEHDLKEYYTLYRDRLLHQAVPAADAESTEDAAGFALVKDQVDREVRVRGIFQYLLEEAAREGSVKVVFDRFVGKDDLKQSVCATESGKGLITYRRITTTASGLEELENSGVRFGRDFRLAVLASSRGELPALGSRAYLIGPRGHGRCIYRLLQVQKGTEPEGK